MQNHISKKSLLQNGSVQTETITHFFVCKQVKRRLHTRRAEKRTGNEIVECLAILIAIGEALKS